MNLVTLEQTIISLAICVAGSIFVHDMHIDKATIVAMTPKQMSHRLESTVKISSHLHTHAERNSLGQAVKDVNNASNHLHARYRERKHLKAKYLSGGGMLTPNELLL